MATTSIGSSGVTFPDSTTLATAASIIPGIKGQAFTSSGTFTIPTGITALKVTVVGGGGGGGNTSSGSFNQSVAGGGGSGATAISYLTGLTSGNTIAVTVGGGGGGSGSGGQSKIASGTQTITTVTANGGSAGTANTASASSGGAGGSASGGTINIGGTPGGTGFIVGGCPAQGLTGYGGNSIFSGGGSSVYSNLSNGNSATGYGSGGSGSVQYYACSGKTGGSGFGGIVIFEW